MTYYQLRTKQHFVIGVLVSLALSSLPGVYPAISLAHGGHGNEFKGGNKATQSKDAIAVDPETAKRMGLKVEHVTSKRLALGIQTTGQITHMPDRKAEVTTPIKGTVVKLFVKPGAVVKAGQVLAILSSPELGELRVSAIEKRAEADVDLRLAQQNYDRQKQLAVVDTAQARTELKVDRERYDRDRELQERGAISRRQFLESESKLAVAKAAVTKAESRLQVLEADAQEKRAQSRVQLSSAAYDARLRQLGVNANSDGTIAITAPIDGAIADREISLGESVEEAGKPLMTIVDSTTVLATANVYEKDLNKVEAGQSVRVKVAGVPDRTFRGKVTIISSVVEGESRVVPVQAEIDNANGLLKPGMFAELEILTERSPEAVLTIPQSAIVEANGQQIVYVQNGKAYQPVNITVGRKSGDLVEIKDGLFEGDLVVTQRGMQLYAQSLRGGKKVEDAHSDTAPETNLATMSGNSQIPWWIVLPIGGAIAAVTFFATDYWANRRHRQQMAAITDGSNYNSDGHGNGHNGLTTLSLDFHQSQTPKPTSAPETQRNPTQNN